MEEEGENDREEEEENDMKEEEGDNLRRERSKLAKRGIGISHHSK